MTTTIINNGARLGNHFLKNVAVSLIAEKYNLYVTYASNELIKQLGIDLFCGSNNYENKIELNDDNYFFIYNCGDLKSNLDPNKHYFQSKDITNFIYNYLHTDNIKSNIINSNPFRNLYNLNNYLYIHIRLGDVERLNPGINYYLNTIKNINFDNLYISSDDINHNIIKEIIKQYPNTKIIDYDEIRTIQFASTCKNIILSHGSFSAIIGYLSFFSNVYYPEYGIIWHGDMFSINGWTKISSGVIGLAEDIRATEITEVTITTEVTRATEELGAKEVTEVTRTLTNKSTNKLMIIDRKYNRQIESSKLHSLVQEAETNREWDFTGVVVLDDKSFQEQVELFTKHRIFISRHGSSMINLLWIPNNSIIFELDGGSDGLINNCYSRICKLTNSKHIVLNYDDYDCKKDIFDKIKLLDV